MTDVSEAPVLFDPAEWTLRASPVHLDLADVSVETWERIGPAVLGMARSSPWWTGDWLVAGERLRGAGLLAAADLTGLSADTLRRAHRVAAAFPPGTRSLLVPWTLHRVICESQAAPETYGSWLVGCEENGWTADQLRAEIRRDQALPVDSEPGPAGGRPVRVSVPAAHVTVVLGLLERVSRVLVGSLSVPEVEVLEGLRAELRRVAS